MLLNFSYYLTVKTFPMGHYVFKEGEECNFIAIVKKGSYEMSKKVSSSVKDDIDLKNMLATLSDI
jgi:CRP-like cAMP-binding protein